MARGPKKHMKRVVAPKSWVLNKMGGSWVRRSPLLPGARAAPLNPRSLVSLCLRLRNRPRVLLPVRTRCVSLCRSPSPCVTV
jgi:small subunit ribosomal protein S4e